MLLYQVRVTTFALNFQALNNTDLMGRQIFVREDREASRGNYNKGGEGGGGVGGGNNASGEREPCLEGGKSVYVGNLAYEVAWQDLKVRQRLILVNV